ncbi:hypothetical protein NDA18_004218 [Ustilago nuda]|nr:hypothetical protein NDA18_004218 [Ustilago nuda]
MPPSTRAGHTGREERDDDQAAATTGNGREEGWLMQVVRILQLANLALTAEEAIVRAMSLISISNQAPKGEVEKIPKDVSSAITHIKKLSDNNWHTWEHTFINCLQWVHNAKEILYGEIAPGSEGYDGDLDKVLDHIHTVRLYNRDVVRLGKELDSIWNDAVRLGKRFDEDLKKSTLYRCTAQDWFYANSVDALKTAKPDSIDGGERPACNTWIVDSGVTHHMVNDERMLLTSTSKDGQISTAGDERLWVKAIGDASLWVGEATIQLLDVLYVPKLNSNLLSIQGLIKNSARVTFDEFGTTIKQNDGTQVQFRRNRRQGRFEVRGQALTLELEKTLNNIPEDGKDTGDRDSYLWHERFGHLGWDKTRQIWVHYLGTDERMEHKSKLCNTCSQGKQTRVQMSHLESKRAEAPLELVHVDLMTDLKGHANYHYAVVAVDDFSSLIYMEPLCTKSATLTALRRWITRIE